LFILDESPQKHPSQNINSRERNPSIKNLVDQRKTKTQHGKSIKDNIKFKSYLENHLKRKGSKHHPDADKRQGVSSRNGKKEEN